MGVVYRAHDSRLQRDVALKLVHPHLVDENRLERFRGEARVLAALGHPNVASVYELGDADGMTFIVMELVPGETLADRLMTGPLPWSDVVRIASQVAAALESVHDKGLIHRDLKPANIKLTPDGVVKVLDFGLAKATGGIGGSHSDLLTASVKTREGVIAGTVAYMSPEQARGQEIDRRTDIWAFGCVVYEMVVGRPAFAAATTADTIAAVMERPVNWAAIPPDVPPVVARVLRRCLQRDPKQRLRDIADARLELEDATTNAESVAVPQDRKWRQVLTAMGVLATGFGLGALAISMTRPASDPVPPARFVVSLPSTTPLAGLDFPSAIISPDGRRVVFVASRGGRTELFQRSLNSIDPLPIPGTTNAVGPFFSPDAQWVAFFADGQLKKVNLAGGPPVTLCEAPVGLEIGLGTRPAATARDFANGNLRATNAPLDLAIEGRGFFQVSMPNGETAYTRAGSMHLSAEGALVTADGFAIEPQITIPENAVSVTISKTGIVSAQIAGQTATQEVGTLELASFQNPAGLRALGSNLFATTTASGEPTTGVPGEEGIGTLAQGFLEDSNVSVVEEMVNMILAQRAYEANSKVVRASDEMLTQVNNLVR